MKTILLPTDFSDTAKNAVNYAITLFADERSRFILLNAYEVPHSGADMLVSIQDILHEESVNALKREVKELREKNPDIEFDAVSELGETISVIDKVANREMVDFIVLGTTGASGLKEILVGSNAAGVIRKVKHPVIAVPENTTYHKPLKIVFAADYEEISDERALDPMKELTEKFNSTIDILNVVREGVLADVDQATQGLRLDHYLEGIQHSYHFISNDDPAEGINRYLEKSEADLLAMVTRKTSFLERIFQKSVTKKIAMHSHIPLLAMHS